MKKDIPFLILIILLVLNGFLRILITSYISVKILTFSLFSILIVYIYCLFVEIYNKDFLEIPKLVYNHIIKLFKFFFL